VQITHGQEVAPDRDRRRGKDLRDARKRGVLEHHHPALSLERAPRNAGALEPGGPGKTGRELLQLRDRGGVVDLVRVAPVGGRPGCLRDGALGVVDRLRARLRILHAGEREHPREVRPVGLARGFQRGIGTKVVVAIRHSESRLPDEHHVGVRVLVVRVDPHRDDAPDPEVRIAHGSGEIVARAERLKSGEILRDGLHSGRFDSGLVPEGLVEIAQLLLLGVEVAPRAQLGDDRLHPLFVAEAHLEPGPRRGPVGRNDGRPKPASIGVNEEVVSGIGGSVDEIEIHAPRGHAERGRGTRSGSVCRQREGAEKKEGHRPLHVESNPTSVARDESRREGRNDMEGYS